MEDCRSTTCWDHSDDGNGLLLLSVFAIKKLSPPRWKQFATASHQYASGFVRRGWNMLLWWMHLKSWLLHSLSLLPPSARSIGPIFVWAWNGPAAVSQVVKVGCHGVWVLVCVCVCLSFAASFAFSLSVEFNSLVFIGMNVTWAELPKDPEYSSLSWKKQRNYCKYLPHVLHSLSPFSLSSLLFISWYFSPSLGAAVAHGSSPERPCGINPF